MQANDQPTQRYDSPQVYAYSLAAKQDSAGGTPGADGSRAILDTHGPSCYAPYTATALSGG